MKYRLMDILACPICKRFPLELHVFKENIVGGKGKTRLSTCEEFCGLSYEKVSEMKDKPDCDACMTREIESGILICGECGRWYPIIEEIPHMLPDELRDQKEDKAFLERNREKVPTSVLESGKPFNLAK
ncbi:MAG: Trm112 family protein [Candidatus Geothermarchaeales archaeon]